MCNHVVLRNHIYRGRGTFLFLNGRRGRARELPPQRQLHTNNPATRNTRAITTPGHLTQPGLSPVSRYTEHAIHISHGSVVGPEDAWPRGAPL